MSDNFYDIVIENKVPICYNIGNKEKESVNQLKEKLQEFWKKVQKFFANMYTETPNKEKMRKVTGLSVMFLRPF